LVGVVWLIAVNGDSEQPVAAEPEVPTAVVQAPAAAPESAPTPAPAAAATVASGEFASKYPVQSCKAAIAAIMGRDPKTMNGRKLGDGMIHVSYRRPDDGKRWEARCEMVGDNQLRWAAFNAFGDGQMGRWRSEDRIDISIADGKMKVDVSQSGTPVNSESFSLKSLS
jgi:hypothetical protein